MLWAIVFQTCAMLCGVQAVMAKKGTVAVLWLVPMCVASFASILAQHAGL